MKKHKRQVVASKVAWEEGKGEGKEEGGKKLLKAGSKVLEGLFIITFKAFYYGKTTRHSKVGRA